MKLNIRILYLYLFSFVGLIIVVVGSINLVNLTLKTLVFKDADLYEVYETAPIDEKGQTTVSPAEQVARQRRDMGRQHQRQFIDAIAALAVGTPLYLYHWKTIKKESAKA